MGKYNYAEEIIRQVPASDAARYYGIKLDRHGFGLCPFHSEKTASFKAFPGTKGWFCFGCSQGGDVIYLVMRLFNIPFMEAVKKLNEDFRLNLPVGRKLSTMQRVAQAQERYRQNAKQEERSKLVIDARLKYFKALEWVRFLRAVENAYMPKDPGDLEDDETLANLDFNKKWVEAVHLLPEAEFELEQAEEYLNEQEQQYEKRT